jgi:hypothetical protein
MTNSSRGLGGFEALSTENSSNEIFLFDTKNFKCLYSNQWALDNIAPSDKNIFDYSLAEIFTSFQENKITNIIAPLFN